MKELKILLVAPASWRERQTAAVRRKLIGKPVSINTGRSIVYVEHNDIVLFVLGEEYEPNLLREMGAQSERCGCRREYTDRTAVASKIVSLLEEQTRGQEKRPPAR